MGTPRSGSLNESIELLRVETDYFDLYISGKPFHPTVEALQLHRDHDNWVDASLEVVKGNYPIVIKRVLYYSPVQNCLVELGDAEVYPCFYENQNYQLVIQSKTEKKLIFHHDSIYLRNAVKPLGKEILTGVLNFKNEVGYTDFRILIEGRTAINIRLEIFPAKLDYKKDYLDILHDVNREIYNLSFDFLRKTYQLTGFRESKSQSLTEFFTILKHIFRQLINAIERINAFPNYRLEKEQQIKSPHRVHRAGKENILYLRKHPYTLIPKEDGIIKVNEGNYHPSKLLENKRRIDFDTSENRFIRWLLFRISAKLKEIKRYLKDKDRFSDPLFFKQIEKIESQISRLLQSDFLHNVGEMHHMSISLVLQMAPGYRDVFRCYLLLMKGLSIQGDLLNLSMKDLAQLYEYWCFIKIHSLLKEKYELVKQDIIQVNRNGLYVTLVKSKKASVTYRNPKNGEIFVLYYNLLPSHSSEWPTLPQNPDNVLTLKKRDSNIEYKYIFDAKYRLNPAYQGSDYFKKYQNPGPEEEDINTMHRYRDAIVSQNQITRDFERTMFGAYILFPYSDEEKFRQHHFYKSIKKVNVGALPFLPNSTKLVEEFLDELIIDNPEKAYERSTRPIGTDQYYLDKLSGKNVLVGALRTKDQLNICLEHYFYHIPLRHLIDEQKHLTNISYIAICQSRRLFGSKESGIYWIGNVINWNIVRRKEITEIPVRNKNDDELYVRFSISNWERRDTPIELGGHGVYSHLFTSKYILDRAFEIAELKLETEEQLKEWREKRRLGKVKVKIDHEYVDKAKNILGMDIQKS